MDKFERYEAIPSAETQIPNAETKANREQAYSDVESLLNLKEIVRGTSVAITQKDGGVIKGTMASVVWDSVSDEPAFMIKTEGTGEMATVSRADVLEIDNASAQ